VHIYKENLMAKINFSPAPQGTLVSGMEAGALFNYPVSARGNTGISVRIKDSKVGKNRFANLHTGKLLTASAGDRGQVLDSGTLSIG
jgi:hypothetical protein